MNKAELIDAVNASGHFESKAAAGRALDIVTECISESLEKGHDVKIAGFGNFVVKHKKARDARNPMTGDIIKVPKKKVAKFSPAAALRRRVDY